MNSIYFDTSMTDAERRRHLYEGQLFVFGRRPRTIAQCELGQPDAISVQSSLVTNLVLASTLQGNTATVFLDAGGRDRR